MIYLILGSGLVGMLLGILICSITSIFKTIHHEQKHENSERYSKFTGESF